MPILRAASSIDSRAVSRAHKHCGIDQRWGALRSHAIGRFSRTAMSLIHDSRGAKNDELTR
jgi:hypothetical protein